MGADEREKRIRRINEKIADFMQRPRNVTFNEIEWVIKQLQFFHGRTGAYIRKANHGMLIKILDRRLNISKHNPRNRQLKAVYVRAFVGMMNDLGWGE